MQSVTITTDRYAWVTSKLGGVCVYSTSDHSKLASLEPGVMAHGGKRIVSVTEVSDIVSALRCIKSRDPYLFFYLLLLSSSF